MTLLVILVALLWDYWRPLPAPSPLAHPMEQAGSWLLQHFNAGTAHHGLLAWAVGALCPAALIGLLGGLLSSAGWALGAVWSVVTLYFACGFRQVVLCNDRIAQCIATGQPNLACALLEDASARPAPTALPELAEAAQRQALRASLHRLFAPLFWFVLLGPFGAGLYALTLCMTSQWRQAPEFQASVSKVLEGMEWLPSRLLALSFAVVGNFEDTLMAWRGGSESEALTSVEVILATGRAAIGLAQTSAVKSGPDASTEWQTEDLQGPVNLIFRALLLWCFVLLVFWLGQAAG